MVDRLLYHRLDSVVLVLVLNVRMELIQVLVDMVVDHHMEEEVAMEVEGVDTTTEEAGDTAIGVVVMEDSREGKSY